MPSVLPFVGAGVVALIGLALVYFLALRGGGKRRGRKTRAPDRLAVIRNAERRLAQESRDPEANLALGDLHFREENYPEAYKHYRLLLDLCGSNHQLDELLITVRHALSALHSGKEEEAYRGLMIAWSMDKSSFDVNYNLGILEYKRKAYPRAEAILTAALAVKPEHPLANKYLGLSLFKLKRHTAAVAILRAWVDAHPEDRECLSVVGQCYYYMKRYDQATRIFARLRPDPEHGPLACLYAATIRLNEKGYEQAIADLEIGLRHQNLPPDMALEMRYRLAAAQLKMNRVDQAIAAWREIVAVNPGFRDAAQLLRSYQELSANKYLQVYLLGSASDFVNLCRRIVRVYAENGTVKITDVTMRGNEHADVLAEVNTRKWEEIVLFRFLRASGDVGDLPVRDLNERLKDIRAGHGVCFTAGQFHEAAKTYVAARLIDLREKDQLLKLLDKLARRPHIVA